MSADYKTLNRSQVEYYSNLYESGYPFNHPSRRYRTIYSIFLAERLKFILKNVREDSKVLDMGCGRGDISARVAEKAGSVVAMDVCPQAIDKANEVNKADNIEFFCGCIEEYKREGKFDAVLLIDIVEHLSDFEAVLPEIADKLKKGGILVISTPNRARFFNRFPIKQAKYLAKKILGKGRKTDKSTAVDAHVKEYTAVELRDLLEKNGLAVKEIKGLILFDFM
jgi:ubiquinone biosynthesis O-methyltransferase